jgi:hypothetical protein
MKKIMKSGFEICIDGKVFEGRNEVFIGVRKVGVNEGICVFEDVDFVRKVGIGKVVKKLIEKKFGGGGSDGQ